MKLLRSIIAISAACFMSTAAFAEPITLSDKQMDGVTAGDRPSGLNPNDDLSGVIGSGLFRAQTLGTTAFGGPGLQNIIDHVPDHTPIKAPLDAEGNGPVVAGGKVTAQALNSPSVNVGPAP